MSSSDVHDGTPSTEPAPVDGPDTRALHRARLHGRPDPERSWTPLGTIDAGVVAAVDDAGLVRIGDRSWSLDWWIGAEDRWHHPSREPSVRRRAVDGSPVVETALRVPGGDVVHRAYGVQASAGDWRGPAVVVEVANLTAVPVALAFVVRPVTLDGPGRITEVRTEGPVVLVDGRTQLLLARDPARVAAGPAGGVAARLAAGDDRSHPVEVVDPGGDLEVALVVPLPHTAVARVLLPVTAGPRRRSATASAVPSAPWDAPPASAVATGWSVHGGDRVRIVAPEPEWDEALAWATRLLQLAGPDEVGDCLDRARPAPAGPPASVRAAEVAEALARLGVVDGSDAIAGALAGAQRLGGGSRLGDRSDGTVALLHAAAPVLAGPYGGARVEDLLAPVAVAVRRVGKGRGVDGGLAPSAVRALRNLAPALVAIGQPEVAEDALVAAARLGGPDAPPSVAPAAAAGPALAGGSTLAAARVARDAVARNGGVDVVRELWRGHATSGRSDAEAPSSSGEGADPTGVLGFDTAELAARTNALLDLFVGDGERGPDLLPVAPSGWLGGGVEGHGLATPWGVVSYAVRWHGGRPAVLWEIEPPAGVDPDVTVPEVRSSGLDPAWRGTGWRGEALLGAPGSDGPAGGVGDTARAVDGGGGPGPQPPGEGDSFA